MNNNGANAQRRADTKALEIDKAKTFIRQRGVCLSCHLPLQWCREDVRWKNVREKWIAFIREVRGDQTLTVNEYGRENQTNICTENMNRCHLINSCMTQEITKMNVFVTPPNVFTKVYCDKSFYVASPQSQATDCKILRFEPGQLQILTGNCNVVRLSQLSDYLTASGVNYFLACANCNRDHTGLSEVVNLFVSVYGQNLNQQEIGISNVVYTLVFDCMKRPFSQYIDVDDSRRVYWHFESWLYFVCIMFLAQNNDRGIPNQNKDLYYMTKSHIHMGVMDLYMSQIIATLLYANFDIPYDFAFLHQTCLSMLPFWAEKAQVLNTDISDPMRCLWRWVLGTPKLDNAGNLECMCDYDEIPNSDPGSEYVYRGPIQNVFTLKLTQFYQCWVKPIGYAIMDMAPEPYFNVHLYDSLKRFILFRTNPNFYNELSQLTAVRIPNGGNYSLSAVMITYPCLRVLEEELKKITNTGPLIMYENLLHLTYARSLRWKEKFGNGNQNLDTAWADYMTALSQLER